MVRRRGLLHNVHTFESLGLRDYRLLWLSHLTAQFGQWMDQVSRGWLMYSLTHSALQLGLVSAVRGVPLLFLGVIAGVAADRYNRKAQLIIAQTVNALLNAALAILILTGRIEFWHLYVTGFLAGTVQAFQQPARQALINDLAGGKSLMNAVALLSGANNLSRSVGPSICGLIVQAFGVDISYFVQAALYALATLWTAQIKVPEPSTPPGYSTGSTNQSFFASAKEGIAYITSHRLILTIIVLSLAPTFLAMPYVSLMPIFAVDVFHGDASTQGLLLTMPGIGAIAGALVIASLSRRQGNGKLLIAGAASYGLSLVLFSQSPALQMAMVFTFIIGFSNTTYMSQNQTILQTLTPQELRGRVLGIYFLDRGLMPLGSLLAGALASLLGAPWGVTIMGASCLLLVVGINLLMPSLWKLNLALSSERQHDTIEY